MRTSIEIKGGKFIKDGKVEPWQFGNWEQIKAVEQKLKEVEEKETIGIVVEPDFDVTIEATVLFTCECGKRNWIHASPDDEEDIDCFDGLDKNCTCGRLYKINKDDAGELRLKEIKR